MSDETTDTEIPEDEKVAKRTISPEAEKIDVEATLTSVISEVESQRKVLKSQANTILVLAGFICLIIVAFSREGKTVRALIAEAVVENAPS